ILHIRALELRPEYRGLGIGETLLSRMIADAGTQGITRIHIELPTAAEGFSRVLLRESFKPCTVRYCRDMEQDI
ncbi:MAG: GNAT family N-acetyltransferase, partial [Treponema sp.]|nr:GNAT family N-acetyltransferase [Treponema sp.]